MDDLTQPEPEPGSHSGSADYSSSNSRNSSSSHEELTSSPRIKTVPSELVSISHARFYMRKCMQAVTLCSSSPYILHCTMPAAMSQLILQIKTTFTAVLQQSSHSGSLTDAHHPLFSPIHLSLHPDHHATTKVSTRGHLYDVKPPHPHASPRSPFP